LSRRGFVEGEHLIVDRYSGGGQTGSYADLARAVVATNPDAIFTSGYPMVAGLLMTWRAAIGLQRLMISEGPTFPEIATRLSLRISTAMRQPLAQFLESHGSSQVLAEKLAAATVDRLTSRGRLNRLVGIRPAYPSLPGKNQLDDIDRAAVENAVRQLCELRAGKQAVSSI
jgi:hypothetical protein